MIEFLVSQDRNQVIELKETSEVDIVSAYYEDTYYGENLFVDNKLVGTYETYRQAKQELMNIYNLDVEIYGVDGYNDYVFSLEPPETTV